VNRNLILAVGELGNAFASRVRFYVDPKLNGGLSEFLVSSFSFEVWEGN
jgi:histidine ammonia-lyase